MAEDVPENHVVSEDVGMLTGVTELACPFFHGYQVSELCVYATCLVELLLLQFMNGARQKVCRLLKPLSENKSRVMIHRLQQMGYTGWSFKRSRELSFPNILMYIVVIYFPNARPTGRAEDV